MKLFILGFLWTVAYEVIEIKARGCRAEIKVH